MVQINTLIGKRPVAAILLQLYLIKKNENKDVHNNYSGS